LIDYYPDTAVIDTAKKIYNLAEKAFGEKKYIVAKEYYKQAIALQPNYYAATIYLGDMYWHLRNPDSAIYFFRKGISMHNDLLEPRKYLVDALADAERYLDAKKECIEAISLYPDANMFEKWSDLVSFSNIKFNRHWIKRGCMPNNLKYKTLKAKSTPWKIYQAAMEDVRQYADSNGVLSENNVTKAQYIEVYCWEKMLNSFKEIPLEFQFAKKMMDKGFLDCYIFISEFHYDIYPQFTDFSKKNKDRIATYMNAFMID